jgi:hypothetical protein
LNVGVSTFARIVGVSTIALGDDLAGIVVSREQRNARRKIAVSRETTILNCTPK